MTVMDTLRAWFHIGEGRLDEDPALNARLDRAEAEASLQLQRVREVRADYDRCSRTRSDPPPSFSHLNDHLDEADALMKEALNHGRPEAE